MLLFPNCKINIGLYVTNRRDDGYHDIETLFYPIDVPDVLEIIPAQDTNLHLSGFSVAVGTTENLVWRAWELLQRRFPGKVQPIDIYLHKVIPMGAGLGGGSADGAFMLRLLNDYFSLSLTREELAALALQLGSDCPFFIYNRPMFATGRGEAMTEADVNLSAYSMQLICPEVHVSTAQAFGRISPKPAPFDLRRIAELPVCEWKAHISNDFELPIFSLHPSIGDIKRQLYEQGAIYASMSGSGAAVYGIFEKGGKAEVHLDLPFRQFCA